MAFFTAAAPTASIRRMGGDDIFIDGEGMVVMFRFENGHVDYKSRYVRTERFKLQEKHRRALFGRYRNRYTRDPSSCRTAIPARPTPTSSGTPASCSRSKKTTCPTS